MGKCHFILYKKWHDSFTVFRVSTLTKTNQRRFISFKVVKIKKEEKCKNILSVSLSSMVLARLSLLRMSFTPWLFSQWRTFLKISPSLLQSIYQVARSCQAVAWQPTRGWLIAVWGASRGRRCQDRPLRGKGSGRARQSELFMTLCHV